MADPLVESFLEEIKQIYLQHLLLRHQYCETRKTGPLARGKKFFFFEWKICLFLNFSVRVSITLFFNKQSFSARTTKSDRHRHVQWKSEGGQVYVT